MDPSSPSLVFPKTCEGVLCPVAYEQPESGQIFWDLMYILDMFRQCGDGRTHHRFMQSFVEAKDAWRLADDHLHLRGPVSERPGVFTAGSPLCAHVF